MGNLNGLKLAHQILTDKSVANKFCMTQLRNRKTLATTSYSDAVKAVEEAYIEQQKKEEVKNDI